MIKVGDTLPAVTLMEYVEVEGNGCSIGPNPVNVANATAGKTIALFALPVQSNMYQATLIKLKL
jgi:peroxiredoxin